MPSPNFSPDVAIWIPIPAALASIFLILGAIFWAIDIAKGAVFLGSHRAKKSGTRRQSAKSSDLLHRTGPTEGTDPSRHEGIAARYLPRTTPRRVRILGLATVGAVALGVGIISFTNPASGCLAGGGDVKDIAGWDAVDLKSDNHWAKGVNGSLCHYTGSPEIAGASTGVDLEALGFTTDVKASERLNSGKSCVPSNVYVKFGTKASVFECFTPNEMDVVFGGRKWACYVSMLGADLAKDEAHTRDQAELLVQQVIQKQPNCA